MRRDSASCGCDWLRQSVRIWSWRPERSGRASTPDKLLPPFRPREIQREASRAAGDAGPLHHEARAGSARRGARGSMRERMPDEQEGGSTGSPPSRG